MAGILQRRPLVVFYVLAVALSAVIGPLRSSLMPPADPGVHPYQHLWDWFYDHQLHINIKNLVLFALDGHDWAYLIFLFAGIPTIAAIVVCAMYRGRSGLTSLFRRLLPWMSAGDRPRALRAYLVLITAYGVGVATYLLLGKLTGQPREIQQVQDILGNSLSLGALIIVGGLFLDEGGTLEELGWRGFAMPLLQQQYTPLVAAVILGILWWAWHFPREIATLPENYDSLAFWGLQAQFLAYVILLSIVIAYFVNLTGGSVLPAIIIHGGTNFWTKGLGHPVQLDLVVDPRLLIFIAATIVILWVSGPRLGLLPGQEISTPISPGRAHRPVPSTDSRTD